MLYSLNNAYPVPMPNRIRLPSGETRTDRQYTPEELAAAGYVEVAAKPADNADNKVLWDGEVGNWSLVPRTAAQANEYLDKRIDSLFAQISLGWEG